MQLDSFNEPLVLLIGPVAVTFSTDHFHLAVDLLLGLQVASTRRVTQEGQLASVALTNLRSLDESFEDGSLVLATLLVSLIIDSHCLRAELSKRGPRGPLL